MGIKSFLGYILSLAGVFGLAMTYEPIAKKVPITLPTSLSGTTLLIASAVLLILGIILITTSKKSLGKDKKNMEVPIYQGKEIIGYRKQ